MLLGLADVVSCPFSTYRVMSAGFSTFSVMSARVVCVLVLAVRYDLMWQELSWGLPLAEILQCTHSSDAVQYMFAGL